MYACSEGMDAQCTVYALRPHQAEELSVVLDGPYIPQYHLIASMLKVLPASITSLTRCKIYILKNLTSAILFF